MGPAVRKTRQTAAMEGDGTRAGGGVEEGMDGGLQAEVTKQIHLDIQPHCQCL